MSRSTRSFWRLGAVVVALSLVAAGCGSDDDNGNADSTNTTKGATVAAPTPILCGKGSSDAVSLAFVGPATGSDANLGINIEQGALLAIQQENARQSKVKFVLEQCDTQGNKDFAPGQFALYKNDPSVLALVGPAFSGETKAVLPDLQAAGLVMVSASATNADLPTLVPTSGVFHRVLPDDKAQGEGIAKFLKAKYAGKKIYYIDDTQEYSKGLTDQVSAAMGTPISNSNHTTINKDDDLYSSAVNAAKAAKPDVVFYGGYYSAAGKLKKQLTDAGVTAVFISGDGSLDLGFISAAGAQGEGAIISCPCNLATAASAGALGTFAKAYAAAFKSSKQVQPGTYSSEAFDAANILMKGIEAGNTTREKLLAYVEGLATYDGISKKIEWQANGNLKTTTVYFFQVKKGAFAPLTDTTKL